MSTDAQLTALAQVVLDLKDMHDQIKKVENDYWLNVLLPLIDHQSDTVEEKKTYSEAGDGDAYSYGFEDGMF